VDSAEQYSRLPSHGATPLVETRKNRALS